MKKQVYDLFKGLHNDVKTLDEKGQVLFITMMTISLVRDFCSYIYLTYTGELPPDEKVED